MRQLITNVCCQVISRAKGFSLGYNDIALLNIQLSFCGPSQYHNGMLEKLCKEIQIQIEFPTSHYYILRVHKQVP